MLPKKHMFNYNIFMFYLNLDEIDELAKNNLLISRNRFNIFSFRDNDYFKEKQGNSVKEKVIHYLNTQNINLTGGKIMLLTHLRTMGYIFNPVSFYFCFNNEGKPVCVVAEITNTFKEMKLFLLKKFENGRFEEQHQKLFYVSPFIGLDDWFDFRLKIPGEKLDIHIDDFRDGNKFFFSTLNGNKKPITNSQLFLYMLRYPMVTLKIIVLIHWQALKLWLKGINYHKKNENQQLQQQVINPSGK